MKNKTIDRSILENMVSLLRHRGPDDEGFYYGENIGLGYRRLAIIDLSDKAHQPMSNEDDSKWIIHNGEIYNYMELREELRHLGHIFKSASDTEVILHAYEEWKEGALLRFNGMWAFAIWDVKKRQFFASRDRFGVKPFYYYCDKERFIFASEIKALLQHPCIEKRPNEQAIYDYLISGYGYMDISDYTFFKDIYQIKPAHYVKVDVPRGEIIFKKYWDLNISSPAARKDECGYIDDFNEFFKDAVKLRLRSDVKIGVALSGGLDSSSIACIASQFHKGDRLSSFSSCFEEKDSDERQFIDDILKTNNFEPHFVYAKAENLLSDMDDILWHQEEPYSTLSIFPQWYIMKLAHENGIKVLLTGQGGDETLAGYHKYYLYLFADLFKSLKWRSAFKEMGIYKKIKGNQKGVFKEIAYILLSNSAPRFLKNISSELLKREGQTYLNKDFVRKHRSSVSIEKKFSSILNNDLYNALKISPLPSLLHIDDRSSMAHSVESRSPFLDYRLVEYAFSLPAEYKIRNGQTKFILREAMRDIVPLSIRTRKDKMGFPTPVKSWFKGPLRKVVIDIFNSREFSNRPYFNPKQVRCEFEQLLKHDKPNHLTIWSWVNLELWLRKFIARR